MKEDEELSRLPQIDALSKQSNEAFNELEQLMHNLLSTAKGVL